MMPLWAEILIWAFAIIVGAGGWLFPIPWLDDRPFFRRKRPATRNDKDKDSN
jgi:hypothetical protein